MEYSELISFAKIETINCHKQQGLSCSIKNNELLIESNDEKLVNIKYSEIFVEDIEKHNIFNLNEAFIINVLSGSIEIKANTKRAVFYAHNALSRCINKNGCLCSGTYCGFPAFKIRGLIEGFYGKPWEMKHRRKILSAIASYNMNTYFYGPKDDAYSREKWRTLYERKDLLQVKQMFNMCNKYFLDMYYLLSPGLDIKYSSEDDFNYLIEKYKQVYNLGIRRFGLLLDDIEERKIHKEDSNKFKKLHDAHIYIVGKVYTALKELDNTVEFCVCPTQYHGSGDEEYISSFGKGTPKGCHMFFTGEKICAAKITSEQAKYFHQHTGHTPLYWDNYPVNDMEMSDEFHIDPIIRRDSDLYKYSKGIVVNPMESALCSQFSTLSFADYMWNPTRYSPKESEKEIVQLLLGNKYCEPWSRFRELVYVSHIRNLGHHYKDEPSTYRNNTLCSMIESKNFDALTEYLKETHSYLKLLYKIPQKQYVKECKRWLDTCCEFCKTGLSLLKLYNSGKSYKKMLTLVCRYMARKEDVLKAEMEVLAKTLIC